MVVRISDLPEWDAAATLRDEEDVAAYLNAALELAIEKEDGSVIADAIGVVARARSMSKLAARTGLGRESLYRSLSADGNPSFETILKVTKAFGMKLAITTVGRKGRKPTRKKAAAAKPPAKKATGKMLKAKSGKAIQKRSRAAA